MPSSLRPDASSFESSQLEELRAHLVDAQAAEISATKALTDFDSRVRMDGTTFSSLMSAAQLARDRTTLAYKEWSSAVEALSIASSGIAEPDVLAERPIQDEKAADPLA
jgi:hypothetical protein